MHCSFSTSVSSPLEVFYDNALYELTLGNSRKNKVAMAQGKHEYIVTNEFPTQFSYNAYNTT